MDKHAAHRGSEAVDKSKTGNDSGRYSCPYWFYGLFCHVKGIQEVWKHNAVAIQAGAQEAQKKIIHFVHSSETAIRPLGGGIFVIYENPSFRHDKATEAKGTKPFFKQSHKY